LTHEQVAQVLGRSREAVSNLLRLLKLEISVQESVLDGQLSAGHARALISLPEEVQKQLAQQAMSLQWSVRELEAEVRQRQQSQEEVVPERVKAVAVLPDGVSKWQQSLSERLGVPVKVTANAKGKGKIEIAFSSMETLESLLQRLPIDQQ